MISNVVNGSGAAAWIFWLLVIGGLLYLLVQPEDAGLLGFLTAVFTSIKIESNTLRQRVERLEHAATHG